MFIIKLAFNEYVFNNYFEQLFQIGIILHTTINEHIFLKRFRFKRSFRKTAKPHRHVMVRKSKSSKALNRLRKKNSRTPVGLWIHVQTIKNQSMHIQIHKQELRQCSFVCAWLHRSASFLCAIQTNSYQVYWVVSPAVLDESMLCI